MITQNTQTIKKRKRRLAKHPILRRVAVAAAFIPAVALGPIAVALAYNNMSFTSDKAFAKQLDEAIEKALAWLKANKQTILGKKNITLIKMLNEVNDISPQPLFSDIITSFLATPSRPHCWNRLIDPNSHVDDVELNITIDKEYLDNKWVLYAMAPDKAKVSGDQLGLFNRRKWHRRKLTHQLDALLLLKRTDGQGRNLDELIEHLAERLSDQLVANMAVVDLYVQKVTFVLRAGHPEKIRKRWLERIIANQRADGGWDDRWFCFTSDTRKPVFDSRGKSTNQHATIQALTALYLVKERYPEQFGLK